MKGCIFTLEPVTINHPGRGGEGWEDFRILSTVAGLCFHLEYRITFWYGCIVIPSCLAISNASYTKIFRPLSHLQTQVQNRVQQQPSQPNALNIARYGKAVHSAQCTVGAVSISFLLYTSLCGGNCVHLQ